MSVEDNLTDSHQLLVVFNEEAFPKFLSISKKDLHDVCASPDEASIL